MGNNTHRLAMQRILCVALAATVLAAIPPRSTSANATPVEVASVAENVRYPANGQPDPQGFKSWLIKEAVALLASAIRKGDYLVELLLSKLDAKAAKAFHKHARRIADGLDDIAQIPDITMTILREKLRYFLTNELRMNPGTAEVIVGAVETILGVLL
jgi:hypothetical protein